MSVIDGVSHLSYVTSESFSQTENSTSSRGEASQGQTVKAAGSETELFITTHSPKVQMRDLSSVCSAFIFSLSMLTFKIKGDLQTIDWPPAKVAFTRLQAEQPLPTFGSSSLVAVFGG